jgi:hypothetical protein
VLERSTGCNRPGGECEKDIHHAGEDEVHAEQQTAPQPPKVSRIVLERGRLLVMEGDTGLHVPACRSCHGTGLLGVAPAVPGLLGVSQDYLIAQPCGKAKSFSMCSAETRAAWL